MTRSYVTVGGKNRISSLGNWLKAEIAAAIRQDLIAGSSWLAGVSASSPPPNFNYYPIRYCHSYRLFSALHTRSNKSRQPVYPRFIPP